MFKGHPKGLLAAALSNMGERFGNPSGQIPWT